MRATVLLRFDYPGPDEPSDRLRVYAKDFSGAVDVHSLWPLGLAFCAYRLPARVVSE